jgi:hypothetical protein
MRLSLTKTAVIDEPASPEIKKLSVQKSFTRFRKIWNLLHAFSSSTD